MIPINVELLDDLVHQLGGPTALMDEWAHRFRETPDRDTFHDWRTQPKFRSNLKSYLRLCACVDVDPIALIPSSYFDGASFGDFILMLTVGQVGGRGIKVQDIFQTFGPLQIWPSPKDIRSAFGRDWVRKYFSNTGRSQSVFEALKIEFVSAAGPRLVHFAYRVREAERWRMYGSVFLFKNEGKLIHLYGPNQNREIRTQHEIFVRTRFGEDPCEFCLASLHEFEITLIGESPELDCMRFSS